MSLIQFFFLSTTCVFVSNQLLFDCPTLQKCLSTPLPTVELGGCFHIKNTTFPTRPAILPLFNNKTVITIKASDQKPGSHQTLVLITTVNVQTPAELSFQMELQPFVTHFPAVKSELEVHFSFHPNPHPSSLVCVKARNLQC